MLQDSLFLPVKVTNLSNLLLFKQEHFILENLNFFNISLITFFILIGIFIFHLLIVFLVDRVFPYTDRKYRFFIEKNPRYKESPLYISKTYSNSKGETILKYKRVTCVEVQSF